MRQYKKLVYISIGIICIILFALLYFNRIKNERIVIVDKTGSAPEATVMVIEEASGDIKNELPAEKIKVYITGEVVNPGVYETDANVRVDDVLKLAGGATENADLVNINLAARVSDAQQIIVRAIGETVDKTDIAEQNVNASGGRININAASGTELKTLPGIGEVIAGNIIDYREKNGGFKTIEDIKNVNRIGDKVFEGIKDLIIVN